MGKGIFIAMGMAVLSLVAASTIENSQTLAPPSHLDLSQSRSPFQSVEEFLKGGPLEISLLCYSYLFPGELKGHSIRSIEEQLGKTFNRRNWRWDSTIGNRFLKEALLKEILHKPRGSSLQKSLEILHSRIFQASPRFQNLGSGKEGEAELVKQLLLAVGVPEDVAFLIKTTYTRMIRYQEQKQKRGGSGKSKSTFRFGPRVRTDDRTVNPLPMFLELARHRDVKAGEVQFQFRHILDRYREQQLSLVVEIVYREKNGNVVLLKGRGAVQWIREKIWRAGRGTSVLKGGDILWTTLGEHFRVYPSGWIEDQRVIDSLFDFFKSYQVETVATDTTATDTAIQGVSALPILPVDIIQFLQARHFWPTEPPSPPRDVPLGHKQEAMNRYVMEMNYWGQRFNRLENSINSFL